MRNAIDIKIGDGFLDLDNVAFRFKILNNLFSEEAIPTFYTFPVVIPDTPNNTILLGYNQTPDSVTKLGVEVPVQIFLFGNFFDNAILQLDKYLGSGWDGNLISGNQKKIASLMKIKLRDMDFGDKYNLLTEPNYCVIKFDFSDISNVNFRIADPEFGAFDLTYTVPVSSDPDTFLANLIDEINADTGTHHFTASIYKPFQTNAFDYTAWIAFKGNPTFLQKRMKFYSFSTDLSAIQTNMALESTTIQGWDYYNPFEFHMNAITDPEFRALYESWFGSFNYRFPIIHNPNYSADETDDQPPILNWWHFTEQRHQATYALLHNYYDMPFNPVVACVKISRVIEAISNTIGFNIDTTLFNDPELARLILISNGLIDYVYTEQVDLSLAMPDMTIGEFMSGLKKLFALHFSYDFVNYRIGISKINDIFSKGIYQDYTSTQVGKLLKSNFTKYEGGFNLSFDLDSADEFSSELIKNLTNEQLKDPVEALGDLPSSDNDFFDVRFVSEIRQFYYADKNATSGVTTWRYLCDIIANYRTLEYKNSISTIFSPINTKVNIAKNLYNISGVGSGNYVLRMPSLSQACKSKLQGAELNPFGARLAFYREMDELGTTGELFPFATNDKYNTAGDEIGTLSLRWEGEDGIYENFYTKWLDFLSRAEGYTSSHLMSYNEFLQFKTSMFTRLGIQNYLTSEIDITFDNSKGGLSVAELTLYK